MNQDLQPFFPSDDNQIQEVVASRSPDRFSTAASFQLIFERYRNALLKRWWIVALCLIFITGPAVVYAIIKPAVFKSEAIMWLTSRFSLPGGERLFSEEMSSYMSTQAELMRSPAIQQQAFQTVCATFPEMARMLTNGPLERVPFQLTIVSSPKNSVLNLEAKGRSPAATRAFLDAVITRYLELKNGSHQQSSSGALAGLTEQIKTVEGQIKAQQEQLTAFEMSNNIAYLTEHGLSAGSHLSRLDELLSDLRTEHRMLELLTPEQFSAVGTVQTGAVSAATLPGNRTTDMSSPAIQAVDTAYFQALQQVQLLKATRDQFARVLRPTHTKMVKLNQQIAGLEELLKTLKEEGAQRALAQMATRKKSIELQIDGLESQYRAWETNAAEAGIKLATHDRMKQDLVRSQALYDRLLGLVQTVDLNKNLDQEPLTPLAPASVARPNPLAKIEIAFAGIFLGLATGIGLVFLLESVNDRFVCAAELSYHLPEEVVGQIPETSLSSSKNGSGGLVLRQPQEHHAFAESFRSLRSSLFFMFDESARPRVIMLTSSVPKEGKSTLAAHLAATLAISGSRVLLIDADLRRSSLHKMFDVDLKPGLREVLTKGVAPSSAIVPVALPPTLTEPGDTEPHPPVKLFLLPSGELASGSAEILLGGKVNELLRELASQYDYVIIDSPPMLATDDAMGLASKVDGVFMVVRASYTYSRMVREALDRLHKRHVKVLGLVYNRAAQSSDYYYRYSRDYHTIT